MINYVIEQYKKSTLTVAKGGQDKVVCNNFVKSVDRSWLGSHREDGHNTEGSNSGKEDGQLVVAHGQDGGNEECLVTQL